jgi:hypothetical protein
MRPAVLGAVGDVVDAEGPFYVGMDAVNYARKGPGTEAAPARSHRLYWRRLGLKIR